jgi:hypothetical protein
LKRDTDIAKDIYGLYKKHQSDKEMLHRLAGFVENTESYLRRLNERQELGGVTYSIALSTFVLESNEYLVTLSESLSTAFETAKERLVDLRNELRRGRPDFGVYHRIRDIDVELKNG